MAQTKDTFGDDRLKKDAGEQVRGSRNSADVDRVQEDGSTLNSAERRRLLRQGWVQEVLPKPPIIPGFHCCWLSTTNSTDPIYKRIQRGYVPVKASEIPGFGTQFTVPEGEFEGCIACNEMLLFKIPAQTYEDLMMIYHHEMPMEQEESIKEMVKRKQEEDSSGRSLGQVEGDFENLGRGPGRNPTFIS